MATTPRETIMLALMVLLESAYEFKTVGRRVLPWQKVMAQPAIFVRNTGGDYNPKSPLPPNRDIEIEVWVYAKSGPGESDAPGAVLNNILDAIDDVLAPSPVTGKLTLGGLVEHCRIEGRAAYDAGDLDSQAKAIVPVKILIP